MATEPINLPLELFTRAREVAAHEEISVEELVAEAVEKRINGKGFAGVYAIARKRGQQTGVTPENVDEIVAAEIAARRLSRSR